jgi:DNA invertase Pin-like site-specific DNA recombinase
MSDRKEPSAQDEPQTTTVAVWGRVRIQALVLFALLTGDGLAILVLGGPAWLTLAYLALGIALAIGRLGLASRALAVEPATSAALAPAPVTAAPPQPEPRAPCALGYVRVRRDGLSSELTEHGDAIRDWCDGSGVDLLVVVHDVEHDARDAGAQPALRGVLERISAGEAQTLVVARLGHLSSSVANLSPLLSWFGDGDKTLVAIDLRLDTATEAGRLAATALASVGGWEHDRLSARTRRGLEAARARGSGTGRAAVCDMPELRDRIAAMREAGMTLQAIADVLNEDGVPTLRGGVMWRPSSVQRATGYRRPASHRPSGYLPGSGFEDEPAGPPA